MPIPTSWIMHITPAGWITWFTAKWLKPKPIQTALLFIAITLLGFIPLYHSNIALYLGGFISLLSFGSFYFVITLLLQQAYPQYFVFNRKPGSWLIFILGFLLYLFTISYWTSFNFYNLGLQPKLLVAVLACCALIAIKKENHFLLLYLLFSLLIQNLRIWPDHNLWDILFDPLLWIGCTLFSFVSFFKYNK